MPHSLDMPQPPRAERWEVLAALRDLQPGTWIATDADNTLWAGDVGDEVVRTAATPPHVPWRPGDADLERYAELMRRSYLEGCKFSAALLANVAFSEARERLVPAFAARVTPRRWLVEALLTARDRGVRIVVISASPAPAVHLGLELAGLGGCDVIALACTPGKTPHFAEPLPVGDGKPAALLAGGWPRPDLALGDSDWDLPLIAHARRGLWLIPACDER